MGLPPLASHRCVGGKLALQLHSAVLQSAPDFSIERRRQVYLGNRPPLEVAGRTVIIVDDGIATGAPSWEDGRDGRGNDCARVL